jgi:hypothetical protein
VYLGYVLVAVPGGLVFMSEKIVSICENESLGSVTVNAVDESRDNHYASGALRRCS